MFKQDKVLSIILIIGVIAALFSLEHRFSVEQKNRAVEIAVDYGEMQQLSSSTGMPLANVVKQFKAAGATSLAADVDTVGELLDNGAIQIKSAGDGYILSLQDPKYAGMVSTALGAYVDKLIPTTGNEIAVRGDAQFIRSLPVGVPPEAITTARNLSMNIVPRLTNFPGIDEKSLRRVIDEAASAGAKTVIFGGDQVLGFRSLIDDTADAFKAHNLYYGSIEFGKQKGDAGLSTKLQDRLIRVHSIPQAEMAQLDMPSAIERFTRAARERNIRLAYVRLFDSASADPVAENTEYVLKIATKLRADGFTTEPAHPFAQLTPPIWLLGLMGVGVAAGIGLLISSVVILPARTKIAAFIFGAIVLAALAAAPMDIGRKLVALLSAFTFPTLALVIAGRDVPENPVKASAIGQTVARFVAVVATTVVGGLLIAGLLSSTRFMIKIDQFAGVKSAHLLPLMLVLGLYASGIAWQRGTFAEQKKRASDSIKSLFSQPILVWQGVGIFAALVLVALVVARSGNEPGVGVSPMELKFRALLDHVLYVRPRTKEFLFGHPFLFLGIACAVTGRRRWAAPLLVLGTIGQVSVLNTFCHIHTPIMLSVLRVFNGTVIGLLFGIVLYWIVRRVGLLRLEESK